MVCSIECYIRYIHVELVAPSILEGSQLLDAGESGIGFLSAELRLSTSAPILQLREAMPWGTT